MRFAGKSVVVIGGGRGIGAACAWGFLAGGANVVLGDINTETAEQTAQAMRQTYPQARVLTHRVDVRQQADCFALLDYAATELGYVDILVNSAGIVSPCPSLEVTESDWLNLIGINLNGVFFGCQAAGRIMKARGGNIVNIGSIAAKAAWPGRTSYAAAKYGVTGITESLAVEWAKYNIRVNAVGPTWVKTDLIQQSIQSGTVNLPNLEQATPLGRIAEPEDIANAVLFMASEESGLITGQVLYVDGGFLTGAATAAIRKDF